MPGIHLFFAKQVSSKTWMAGTSPAMTVRIGISHRKSDI
jgi:hypothetical protein